MWGLLGCSSTPEPISVEGPQLTGELSVIVWSKELQGPVAARGTVTPESGDEALPFDTRQDPASGRTLTLTPGRYSVVVSHRYLGTGALQPVTGEQVLYVEPGRRHEVTVVAEDKGEIGWRKPTQHTNASAPPLPLEPSSG